MVQIFLMSLWEGGTNYTLNQHTTIQNPSGNRSEKAANVSTAKTKVANDLKRNVAMRQKQIDEDTNEQSTNKKHRLCTIK